MKRGLTQASSSGPPLMRCAPTRVSRTLSIGSGFRPESEGQASSFRISALTGMKSRRGKHLIQPHGFCHRIHHPPKAGLQFLRVGTVHHSYHVVIFS